VVNLKPSDWLRFHFRSKRLNNIVKYSLKLDEKLTLITRLCEGRVIPPLDWITQIFSLYDSLLRELKFSVPIDMRDRIEQSLTALRLELLNASKTFLGTGEVTPTNILNVLVVCRRVLESIVYNFLEELDEKLREAEEEFSGDILNRLIGIEKKAKEKKIPLLRGDTG